MFDGCVCVGSVLEPGLMGETSGVRSRLWCHSSKLLLLLQPFVCAQTLALNCVAIPLSRVSNSAASCKYLGTSRPFARSRPRNDSTESFPAHPRFLFYLFRASPIAPFRCRAPSLRMRQHRSPIGSPRYLLHGGGLMISIVFDRFPRPGVLSNSGCC